MEELRKEKEESQKMLQQIESEQTSTLKTLKLKSQEWRAKEKTKIMNQLIDNNSDDDDHNR